MTNRLIDHHRVTVDAPFAYGTEIVQIRNAIVAWATKPNNAAELLRGAPTITENLSGDAWTFTLYIRYRTGTDDGDGNDISRVVYPIVRRAIPLTEAHTRVSISGVPVAGA